APDVADLYHTGAVDAEHQFEKVSRVEVTRFAVRVENDAALADPRIEDVIHPQLTREQVDDFGKRSVLETESAKGDRGRRRLSGRLLRRRRRRRSRLRRRGLRLGGRRRVLPGRQRDEQDQRECERLAHLFLGLRLGRGGSALVVRERILL